MCFSVLIGVRPFFAVGESAPPATGREGAGVGETLPTRVSGTGIRLRSVREILKNANGRLRNFANPAFR